MIREIVGARTIASTFMPKKRKRKRNMLTSFSTMGVLAGAGIAYMAMKKRNNNMIDDNDNDD
jgi:hypothetical protein